MSFLNEPIVIASFVYICIISGIARFKKRSRIEWVIKCLWPPNILKLLKLSTGTEVNVEKSNGSKALISVGDTISISTEELAKASNLDVYDYYKSFTPNS